MLRKTLSIVFLSLGFLGIIFFIMNVYLEYRLTKIGIVLNGVVSYIEVKPQGDAPPANLHTIVCLYQDSIYSFVVSLNKVSYNINDSVTIRFNPKNPEGHIGIIDDPDWFNKWLLLVLGICATVFGFWIRKVPKDKLIRIGKKLSNFFDSMGLKG